MNAFTFGRTPPEKVRARALYIPNSSGEEPQEVLINFNSPRADDGDADEGDIYLSIGPKDCETPFLVRLNRAGKEWLHEQLTRECAIRDIIAAEQRARRKESGT